MKKSPAAAMFDEAEQKHSNGDTARSEDTQNDETQKETKADQKLQMDQDDTGAKGMDVASGTDTEDGDQVERTLKVKIGLVPSGINANVEPPLTGTTGQNAKAQQGGEQLRFASLETRQRAHFLATSGAGPRLFLPSVHVSVQKQETLEIKSRVLGRHHQYIRFIFLQQVVDQQEDEHQHQAQAEETEEKNPGESEVGPPSSTNEGTSTGHDEGVDAKKKKQLASVAIALYVTFGENQNGLQCDLATLVDEGSESSSSNSVSYSLKRPGELYKNLIPHFCGKDEEDTKAGSDEDLRGNDVKAEDQDEQSTVNDSEKPNGKRPERQNSNFDPHGRIVLRGGQNPVELSTIVEAPFVQGIEFDDVMTVLVAARYFVFKDKAEYTRFGTALLRKVLKSQSLALFMFNMFSDGDCSARGPSTSSLTPRAPASGGSESSVYVFDSRALPVQGFPERFWWSWSYSVLAIRPFYNVGRCRWVEGLDFSSLFRQEENPSTVALPAVELLSSSSGIVPSDATKNNDEDWFLTEPGSGGGVPPTGFPAQNEKRLWAPFCVEQDEAPVDGVGIRSEEKRLVTLYFLVRIESDAIPGLDEEGDHGDTSASQQEASKTPNRDRNEQTVSISWRRPRFRTQLEATKEQNPDEPFELSEFLMCTELNEAELDQRQVERRLVLEAEEKPDTVVGGCKRGAPAPEGQGFHSLAANQVANCSPRVRSSDTSTSSGSESHSPTSSTAKPARGLQLPDEALAGRYEGVVRHENGGNTPGASGTPTAMLNGATGAQRDAKEIQFQEQYGPEALGGLRTVRQLETPWQDPSQVSRLKAGKIDPERG
ncbi:unnamed protein product [Amoebophrya sp. A120]|nr:unnamed protein product [Amoebophrya sp. A120]|eukprot:GSA120T00013736001.1